MTPSAKAPLFGAVIFFVISALVYALPSAALAGWMFSDPSADNTADITKMYFSDANFVQLAILRNGAVSGRVGVFQHTGIVLLPVGGIAAALGIPITLDAENGVAKGNLPDGRMITIIPGKNAILVGGQEMKQASNLIFLHNQEIYMDISLFNDIFPFTAWLDQVSRTLRISDKPGNTGAEGSLAADTAVAPVTAHDMDSPSPSAATAQPQAKPDAGKKQGGPLVLQLDIDHIAMQEFIDGLEQDGKVYLPLGQLASLLDFSITVDAKAGTAEGWFIREENRFSLAAAKAEIRGKTVTIPPGGILHIDQDLFIDSALLQQWFPLDMSVDRYSMTLHLVAREALPFEKKILREQQKQPAKDVTWKALDYPYSAVSLPFTNVTFGPSYQSRGNQGQAGYSILSAGDMGYMTSRLYAAGNLGDQVVSDLRFSMGRDDYGRNLLGPLKASSFSMGDVDSASLSQVTQTSTGRGFALTNRDLDRPDKFDVTSFTGNSTPGWQVELYRNGTLLDSQVVGQNGRYEFRDVPILFGNNAFRLAFFGPQGQVDEIVKNINAESSLLDAGEFTYNVSADQEAGTLLGISNDSTPGSSGIRSVGELEYGASRWLTLTAGSAHTVINDTEHSYAATGLRTSLAGVLASLDDAYDTGNGGHSANLAMFANYFGTDLHFRQKAARDFFSEEDGTVNNVPVTLLTDIGLDRQSDIPVLGQIDAGLDAMRKGYATGRMENLWISRFSKPVYGINFTNSLQYDSDNLGLQQLAGTAAIRGFYDHMLLGGQADYNIRPDAGINDLKLDAIYPIRTGISGNSGILVNIPGHKSLELDNTVTFDMSKYKLSFSANCDTDRNFFAGISLNFSFGKIPGTGKWLFSSQNMAETGTVVARPYLESNYNQQRDPDESAPPGVSLKIGSQTLKADDDGMAIAGNLPVNQPVGISLNQEKQDNPFWTTATDEYRVVPRPGVPIVLDYPLFETSQVDGAVHVPSGSSAALKIELVNSEEQVVGSTHTAFDGYYLLQGVMPGAYTIRVAKESLDQHRLKQPEERRLVIRKADFYTRDIALMP
jgi:hypothetical protein